MGSRALRSGPHGMVFSHRGTVRVLQRFRSRACERTRLCKEDGAGRVDGGDVCKWRREGAWAWADTASRMDRFSEILANALGAQDPGRPGNPVLQKQAPRPGKRPPLLVPAAQQSPPARTSPPQGRLANQELVNCASDWFASSSHRLMFQELETQLRVKRASTQSRNHISKLRGKEREKKCFLSEEEETHSSREAQTPA